MNPEPPPPPPAEPAVPAPGNTPADPPAAPAAQLSPEEQMAQFEKHLKENDWGHQPC